jgi:anti-sigma B factor antagonist
LVVHGRRLDAAVAERFVEFAWAEIGESRKVILDLSQVSFVDSTALGALVALHKRLGGGESLSLASVRPEIATLFRLTRLDTVFRICPTVEAASGSPAAP